MNLQEINQMHANQMSKVFNSILDSSKPKKEITRQDEDDLADYDNLPADEK